jgi:gamma-glutamylcyclotransferase (GGCT)/AIG2-like uncharacterized protein YtfP
VPWRFLDAGQLSVWSLLVAGVQKPAQTEKNSVRVHVFHFEPQIRTLLDAFELRSIEEQHTNRNPSGPAWTLVSLRQSAVRAEL